MDGGIRRLLDFDRAEVVRLKVFAMEGEPPQYEIRVTGTKPHENVEPTLVPEPQPLDGSEERPRAYPRLLLEGVLREPARQGPVPYEISVALDNHLTGGGLTEEIQGVEIVGAARSERLKLPPEEEPEGECLNWRALHVHGLSGPATLYVRGECRFPSAGYSVELRPRRPQGFNPGDLLLERVVHAPSGVAAAVNTTVTAEYREKTDFEYATATILPANVTVPVQDIPWFTFLEMLMRRTL
jgi:hypothetical protein